MYLSNSGDWIRTSPVKVRKSSYATMVVEETELEQWSKRFVVEFSNDRCAPASAPADIELAAFSRNCYEFNVAKGGSFEDARRQCQNHGGDLIHGFQVIIQHIT